MAHHRTEMETLEDEKQEMTGIFRGTHLAGSERPCTNSMTKVALIPGSPEGSWQRPHSSALPSLYKSCLTSHSMRVSLQLLFFIKRSRATFLRINEQHRISESTSPEMVVLASMPANPGLLLPGAGQSELRAYRQVKNQSQLWILSVTRLSLLLTTYNLVFLLTLFRIFIILVCLGLTLQLWMANISLCGLIWPLTL